MALLGTYNIQDADSIADSEAPVVVTGSIRISSPQGPWLNTYGEIKSTSQASIIVDAEGFQSPYKEQVSRIPGYGKPGQLNGQAEWILSQLNTLLNDQSLSQVAFNPPLPPPPPEPPIPEPTDYKISGSVVDYSTLEPLAGFKIEDENGAVGETFEYGDGLNFEIEGTYTPSSGSYVGKPVKLTFSKEDYKTESGIIAIKRDQTINNSLFPIKLLSKKPASQAGLNQAKESSPEEIEMINTYSKEEAIQLIISKSLEVIEERLVPYVIKKLLGEPFGIYDPIGLIKKAKKLADEAKEKRGELKDKKAKKEESQLREKTDKEILIDDEKEMKEKEWAGREDEIKALEEEKNNFPDDMDEEEIEKEEKKIDKKIEKIRKELKKEKDKFVKWLDKQSD